MEETLNLCTSLLNLKELIKILYKKSFKNYVSLFQEMVTTMCHTMLKEKSKSGHRVCTIFTAT